MYPSCNVTEYLNQDFANKEKVIVSFAQFRPEKRHWLQIEAFSKFIEKAGANLKQTKFVIIGSAKDKLSLDIVADLRNMITGYGLDTLVDIQMNQSMDYVKSVFKKACVGIHTMQDEHFGISIVEMLSAGMVVIAHNSAGPRYDILRSGKGGVKRVYGVLAEDSDDFADKLIVEMEKFVDGESRKEQVRMIENGQRNCIDKFSNEKFF